LLRLEAASNALMSWPPEKLDDRNSLILVGGATDQLGIFMRRRTMFFYPAHAIALSSCGPSGPPPQATFNQPAAFATTSPTANTGPTMSEAGPARPAIDRYGAANFDASGTYIGGHGIGPQVDSPDHPDRTTFGIPKSSMPDISTTHCTGSSISNAGSMNCTN
jgi:hypothetical protein